MTGSLGAAEGETETGERRELINNSICCPAWGSISSVSDCQCVWGGEAGAAAHTVLVLTARRAINGHNLISHYHHQWLLACRALHNSIRQTVVWGWGAPLKFKVIREVRESCEESEQNTADKSWMQRTRPLRHRLTRLLMKNKELKLYNLALYVQNVLILHDGRLKCFYLVISVC